MVCRYLLSATILVLVISLPNQVSNALKYSNSPSKVTEADNSDDKQTSQEKVTLKYFYESLCRYCIRFDPTYSDVANKLNQYVEVLTYPYGNARMTESFDGSVSVECQHGEPECYGNMLHACAIDILKDVPLYLGYNGCLMANRSNDTVAVKCGKQMNLRRRTVNSILECAKGAKGNDLLVKYGIESELVNFNHVPYVMINDAEWDGESEDLMKDVCAAFTNPPEPCLNLD